MLDTELSEVERIIQSTGFDGSGTISTIKEKLDQNPRDDGNGDEYMVVVYSFKNYPHLKNLVNPQTKQFLEMLALYGDTMDDLEVQTQSSSYPGGQGIKIQMNGTWKLMEKAMDDLFNEEILNIPTFIYQPKGKFMWFLYNFPSKGGQINPTKKPYDKVLQMWEKEGLKYTTWDLSHGAALKDSYNIF